MSPEATFTSTFEFVNLFVTKAIFEFLPGQVIDSESRPPIVNVGFEVAASAQVRTDGTGAFVKLDTKIIPDPQWQPYRIEVSIGAAFKSQQATTDDLLVFCRVAVPSILFPYIRERVHSLTADAPQGPVRLNPMNISQLLNQSDWDVTESNSLTSLGSSEPSPPSEQSTSASKE